MEEKKTFIGPPGDFWGRAAALIIDSAVLMICFSILSIVAAIAIPQMTQSLPKEKAGLMTGLLVSALFVGFPCLYFTLSTAFWGCTVGKLVFNLRVARMDGLSVSLPRSFWRWLCSFLFALPLGLGYWVGIFQEEKRTLSDLAAGTKVVLIRPYNQTVLILMLVGFPFFGVFFGGILAAIAVPRFAQMLEKSREGATKENLKTLKSAVSLYHKDHHGKYPGNLEKELVPKYLKVVPPVKATGAFVSKAQSPEGNKVTLGGRGKAPTKSGSGWLYDSVLGKVYINCTVKDSRGIPYSFYGFE